MIITRTPFRISFFGGGTDFPEFYEAHGGAVLTTSIDQHCYISVHPLAPFFKHRFKASYAKTEAVLSPEEFQHPLIRECLLYLKVTQGLEISHVSDLPGRTGLGTSSSFTVGLLHALHALHDQRVTHEDLAREAIHIERVRVGDAGGHQDQYACAYGGFLRLNFAAGARTTIQRVALRQAALTRLESHLQMYYLGNEMSAEAILKDQKQRTSHNISYLKKMLAMVDEAQNILESGENLDAFGRLLHETWQLKKGLSKGISNEQIDQTYQLARDCGALGGKLLGAGGRGFLLLYAPPETHRHLQTRLCDVQNVPFRFSSAGSKVIFKTGTNT